jgi:hypothetical protein
MKTTSATKTTDNELTDKQHFALHNALPDFDITRVLDMLVASSVSINVHTYTRSRKLVFVLQTSAFGKARESMLRA